MKTLVQNLLALFPYHLFGKTKGKRVVSNKGSLHYQDQAILKAHAKRQRIKDRNIALEAKGNKH